MLLEKDGWVSGTAETLIATLAEDHQQADLSDADRAMLDYAITVTHTPAAVTSDDVDRLRQVGFDDVAIHDICAITAYFAFVNRMADGLGVELEARFRKAGG